MRIVCVSGIAGEGHFGSTFRVAPERASPASFYKNQKSLSKFTRKFYAQFSCHWIISFIEFGNNNLLINGNKAHNYNLTTQIS